MLELLKIDQTASVLVEFHEDPPELYLVYLEAGSEGLLEFLIGYLPGAVQVEGFKGRLQLLVGEKLVDIRCRRDEL